MNREERGVGTEKSKGAQDARSLSLRGGFLLEVFVCIGGFVVFLSCGGFPSSLRVGRSWPSLGLFVVGGFFYAKSWVLCALVVYFRSSESLGFGGLGRVVGARSRWGVRAWHEGRGREALLCQLCRASLRIRVENAGESSPTIAPRGCR